MSKFNLNLFAVAVLSLSSDANAIAGDYFQKLPDEIVSQIAESVHYESLDSLARTNRRMHRIVNDPNVRLENVRTNVDEIRSYLTHLRQERETLVADNLRLSQESKHIKNRRTEKRDDVATFSEPFASMSIGAVVAAVLSPQNMVPALTCACINAGAAYGLLAYNSYSLGSLSKQINDITKKIQMNQSSISEIDREIDRKQRRLVFTLFGQKSEIWKSSKKALGQ